MMPFKEVWRLGVPLQLRVDDVEIEDLFDFIQKLDKRQTLVEIGCLQGRSLFTLAQAMEENAWVIGIDLPEGKWGAIKYSMKLSGTISWLGDLGFASAYIHGDSHEERTKMRLVNLLQGRFIDVLVIDGDHTYEGVKQDYEMYAPLVDKLGVVIFHDIAEDCPPHIDGSLVEVRKFWKDLRNSPEQIKVEYSEIYHPGSRMGYGIIRGVA